MTANEELLKIAKTNLVFWQNRTENAYSRLNDCKEMVKEWVIEIRKLEQEII